MKMMHCLFAFMIFFSAQAQQFGGNPPSLKWMQVNNPAARVIFPRGLDTIARSVASAVEQLNRNDAYSLGTLDRKINIVLQNQGTVSNAYVALGPFRSEFYLTPRQNSFELGSLPWHLQLALHEYRHVQQNNNFNVGISKLVGTILGEQGRALANSLVIPDWLYEGDAVFNETVFSEQGRGRVPFFYNGYRSLWSEEKRYSWMKLRNGSLKDYTPDHYQLGYLLVAYGYEQYGNDFWKKVTHDAAAYKGLFYPFQKAIKRYSGKNYRQFRNDALKHFEAAFPADPNQQKPPSADFIADHEFPVYISEDSMLYMKSSYRRLPTFTIAANGKESSIRVRNVALDNQFSYRNGSIVYASSRPDLRWGWRDYSELQKVDVNTGVQSRLTRRSRYFSPDLNEDGSAVIAVNVATDNKFKLHLLNARDGSIKKEIANPQNYFYSYPKFAGLNQVVTTVRDGMGRMSMALVNLVNDETELLLPFSYEVMGFPLVKNDTVWFSSSYLKQDVIMAITLQDKKLFLIEPPVNDSGIGKYQPAVNSNRLTWSGFTAEGLLLQHALKKDLVWKEIAAERWGQTGNSWKTSGVTHLFLNNLRYPDYEVKKYPKATGLLRFHTMLPEFDDPNYSLALLSQNILNTLQTEVSFLYNRNEQFKRIAASGTYGGWFPYVTAGGSFTFDREVLSRSLGVLSYNEAEATAGFRLPFNLSGGRYFRSLTAGVDYVYNQSYITGKYKDSFAVQQFHYLNNYIIFSNQIQKARQHIFPRFAQGITLNFKRGIIKSERSQFLATGNFYFPGLFINHNLVINAAFQQHDTLNQGTFANGLPFSRGYSAVNLYRMKKLGVNYHLPLVYPDAGVANIVYLMRMRANLFFDFTDVPVFFLSNRRIDHDYRSAGTEIFFDTKWWNQLPVSFGVRYSYLFDKDEFGAAGQHRVELILPANLVR